MFEALLSRLKKDHVQLGTKKVEVPKLTRVKLKKLTNHIGTIGDYFVKLIMTPEQDRAVFIVAGADVAIDEIYEITSLLSDVPIEYLDEHASINECIEFVRLTWEKNDMGQALGNLQSLLPPMAEQFVKSLITRAEKGAGSL